MGSDLGAHLSQAATDSGSPFDLAQSTSSAARGNVVIASTEQDVNSSGAYPGDDPAPQPQCDEAIRSVPPLRSRCPTSPLMPPGRSTLMEIDRLLPRSALLDSHINTWFRYIHPVGANGFLHRGSLLRDVREHTVSKNLVVALCAAAGYFVLGAAHEVGLVPTRPLNADSWSNHAKTSLLLDEVVSLENLATALVLNRHFTYCGRLALADIMAAYALRQASLLGLFRDASSAQESSMPWQQQEHRRRLLWACIYPSPLFSAGSDDCLLPRTGGSVRIKLPVEDYNFQLSIRCDASLSDLACQNVDYGSASESIGIMGQYAIIVSARTDAQR
jgi:hypothetical protein